MHLSLEGGRNREALKFNCPVEHLRRIFAVASILALLLPLNGCRLAYLFHAAAGQYRLLHHAVPVDQALQGDTLSSGQRERLSLVAKVKAFGEKELGLSATSNYETVYLRTDRPPIYTVAASPKDRLERITWWFPIVGRMPYLGFFDVEKAREEKNALTSRDLDAVILRAEAYSTLGWFKDPVTLNLIDGSTPELVETILHEMTHVTLYAKGQGEFNEGLAGIVGKRGARLFLQKTFGAAHPFSVEAENLLREERLFSEFLSRLMGRLERLYASPLSYEKKLAEREEVYAEYLEEFKALSRDFQTARFVSFGSNPLNNAYLLSVSLYHRHFSLFETLLDRKGGSVKEMLDALKGLSKKDGDMMEMIRRQTALP